jgi:hypothetical protein
VLGIGVFGICVSGSGGPCRESLVCWAAAPQSITAVEVKIIKTAHLKRLRCQIDANVFLILQPLSGVAC